MRFCHVVLLLTLGMTAEMVLEAQTLPAGPVLVASDTMPEAGLFSPDLLGVSDSSIAGPDARNQPSHGETARRPAHSAAHPAGSADPFLERYLCVPRSVCWAFRRGR